jgi:hypothetical protein
MKKYYVHYYRDFRNSYSLLWADSPEMEAALPEGAEQISRAKAIELARAEKERQKYEPSFAGYAADAIYPADYNSDRDGDLYNDKRYYLNGYIWDRA